MKVQYMFIGILIPLFTLSCRLPSEPIINEYKLIDLDCIRADFGEEYDEFYFWNNNSLPLFTNDSDDCIEYEIVESNDTLHLGFFEESLCVNPNTLERVPSFNSKSECREAYLYWIDYRRPNHYFTRVGEASDSLSLDGNWKWIESKFYIEGRYYEGDLDLDATIESNEDIDFVLTVEDSTILQSIDYENITEYFHGELFYSEAENCDIIEYELEDLDCVIIDFGARYDEFYFNNSDLPIITNDSDECIEYEIVESNDTLYFGFNEESLCVNPNTMERDSLYTTKWECRDACMSWIDFRCPNHYFTRVGEAPDSLSLDGNWKWIESRMYESNECFQMDYTIMDSTISDTINLNFSINGNNIVQTINYESFSDEFNGVLSYDGEFIQGPLNVINHLFFHSIGETNDIDISNNYIVSANNYNGYYVHKIVFDSDSTIIDDSDSTIIELNELFHKADMFSSTGDDRAEKVIISKNHGVAFILDKLDKIWVINLYSPETSFNIENESNNITENCFGNKWLDLAIDDSQLDFIRLYPLVKHFGAEEGIGEDDPSEYDEYSTSLTYIEFNPNPEFDLIETSCEYSNNLGYFVDNVSFSDELLITGEGELGVKIYKQTSSSICFDDENQIISEFESTESYDEDKSNCENPVWMGGFDGTFEPAGGLEPNIFAQFDTPGEVNTVYSTGNTIFAGLSTSNGCYMVLLDSGGNILSTLPFGQGYTINGIHQDTGLIALAAGHYGVLLYDWDGNTGLTELGILETSYANEVKVQGNSIFVATEDGIDIFQIER